MDDVVGCLFTSLSTSYLLARESTSFCSLTVQIVELFVRVQIVELFVRAEFIFIDRS